MSATMFVNDVIKCATWTSPPRKFSAKVNINFKLEFIRQCVKKDKYNEQ